MKNSYTENLGCFGSRERHMAAELLAASLPDNFCNSGVRVAMNMSSGYVFLVNDDYQVAMMNGDTLQVFHTTPYHGFEGFIEDLIAENDPDDMNAEDANYIVEQAETELIELPEKWYAYWLYVNQKETKWDRKVNDDETV